jgi:hypothetical protein
LQGPVIVQRSGAAMTQDFNAGFGGVGVGSRAVHWQDI